MFKKSHNFVAVEMLLRRYLRRYCELDSMKGHWHNHLQHDATAEHGCLMFWYLPGPNTSTLNRAILRGCLHTVLCANGARLYNKYGIGASERLRRLHHSINAIDKLHTPNLFNG